MLCEQAEVYFSQFLRVLSVIYESICWLLGLAQATIAACQQSRQLCGGRVNSQLEPSLALMCRCGQGNLMSPLDTMWSVAKLSWHFLTANTFLDVVVDRPCFHDRGEIWLRTVS